MFVKEKKVRPQGRVFFSQYFREIFSWLPSQDQLGTPFGEDSLSDEVLRVPTEPWRLYGEYSADPSEGIIYLDTLDPYLN